MKRWTPRFALAALALTGATLCCAQTIPTNPAQAAAPRGATYDCSGMNGTALSSCLELNRRAVAPAATSAGPNDCSGLIGAPLDTCRRLNAAEAAAPRSSAGSSEDCSGQIGDALVACRALNGLSNEPATSAPAPAAQNPQQ